MLSFLSGLYRLFRCVREIVVSLFFVIFVMAFFAFVGWFNSESESKKRPMEMFQKGALRLSLDGYLADNRDEMSELHRLMQSELSGSSEPLKISTFDVVRAIKRAESDERISGIVLDLAYFEGGDIPSLTFVGDALSSFKKTGKPVIASGELFTQKQYYLASFADTVYLNKSGAVELNGLSYSNLYFKSLLEKIGAEPHIFRVGTYKSAVEPFLRDDMSPEAKENASRWLNGLWENMRQTMSQNRGVETEKLVPEATEYIQQFRLAKGDEAQFALQQKWVNETLTSGQIRRKLAEIFGSDEEFGYKQIDYFDYEMSLPDRFNVGKQDKIAVINIEGEIVWGESDDSTAGSDDIVPLLEQARKDPAVQGVIVRVNSPGGSAVASELIRQGLEDIQLEGKPVVVSMGGMAASGGYWISATADKIIASPSTLTGSIGIFGLAMNFEKTAKNLGVSQDGIATSPLVENSGLKALGKEQAELIQISIENGYDKFLELVAKGRKLSKAEADKLAQGQVWLGKDAFEKGLVDKLGDFNEAYRTVHTLINEKRKAQNQPELGRLPTEWLANEKTDLLSQVMRDFNLRWNPDLAKLLGLPLGNVLKQPTTLLNRFNDPKQLYLYCLTCGEVK